MCPETTAHPRCGYPFLLFAGLKIGAPSLTEKAFLDVDSSSFMILVISLLGLFWLQLKFFLIGRHLSSLERDVGPEAGMIVQDLLRLLKVPLYLLMATFSLLAMLVVGRIALGDELIVQSLFDWLILGTLVFAYALVVIEILFYFKFGFYWRVIGKRNSCQGSAPSPPPDPPSSST